MAFPVVCLRVICCPLKPRITHRLPFLTRASLSTHPPILSVFKGGQYCPLRHALFTVLWMSSAYSLPGKECVGKPYSISPLLEASGFAISPSWILSLGCEHSCLPPSLFLSILFLPEGKLTISQSVLRKVSRRSPYLLSVTLREKAHACILALLLSSSFELVSSS